MNATSPSLRSRLSVEPLEDRLQPAGGLRSALGGIGTVIPTVSASLNHGVLRVNGTYLPDAISIRQVNGVIRVGGVSGAFAAASINRIEVNGLGSNDVILLNSESMPGAQPIQKPCTVHGGAGNDTIFGGYGNDRLYGDAGDDTIFAGNGIDIVVGGAGMDRLYGGAGNDWLYGDAADAILAGQANLDVVTFDKIDPAALVNYNEAALKNALQMGLDGMSFGKSHDGEKITVKNLEIEDVTIENGITRLHLKASIRYQKTRGFPQFSVSGTIRFSVTPQLTAVFIEGALSSAKVNLADPHVSEINLSHVPNWLDNSSEMRNFLETKLAQQPAINLTPQVQTFLALGGSLGPTIVA